MCCDLDFSHTTFLHQLSPLSQEIQSWFVSKGIHVAGIYVSKENSQKHLDMFLLFKSVGKGRMDLSSKKIWGFTIE